ncbi:hypothetical protein ANN_21240 [Periplaneta americana]|uniref:Uncharacterized protein n=1 Tax=Periplaneta americana TaxID=6978 RepID=A0ABQ8SFZ8_PERAM|nr:hypothetical protein ANN_21240 [Periplaneta americana]
MKLSAEFNPLLFENVPVVIGDVERSFLKYNNVLDDNHWSFTFHNLRMYTVIWREERRGEERRGEERRGEERRGEERRGEERRAVNLRVHCKNDGCQDACLHPLTGVGVLSVPGFPAFRNISARIHSLRALPRALRHHGRAVRMDPMLLDHLGSVNLERGRCSANDKSALYRYKTSANDKSALYRYKTASIDYSRICNRKRISEKSRRLEIQYCRRSISPINLLYPIGYFVNLRVKRKARNGRETVQYVVKTLCAAIRASKRRGKETKRAWICCWGISLHVVCMRVHKRQEWVLEDHDEQVADQSYPRHVRCATYLANVQAREAVISVVLRRRLAQSSPHEAGHCPAEIWHVEFSEREAVPRALKPL